MEPSIIKYCRLRTVNIIVNDKRYQREQLKYDKLILPASAEGITLKAIAILINRAHFTPRLMAATITENH